VVSSPKHARDGFGVAELPKMFEAESYIHVPVKGIVPSSRLEARHEVSKVTSAHFYSADVKGVTRVFVVGKIKVRASAAVTKYVPQSFEVTGCRIAVSLLKKLFYGLLLIVVGQSKWIPEVHIVVSVAIEIVPTPKLNRIFGGEPSYVRVVVSGAVVRF
jgi:hypothetical protein